MDERDEEECEIVNNLNPFYLNILCKKNGWF